MNSSQFKKLIVLLLLVGGVGLLFLSQDRKDWEQSEAKLGGKVIPDFPLNDVASINLKDEEGEINVAKKNEIWTVGDRWDYPADFSKIRDLIQDVWDLKVTRNIKAGPSQFGRLGLVSPGKGANSGILISFNGENSKELHNLLLGKEHMRKSEAPSQFGGGGDFPDGRYVLPDGNGEAIALVSETFSSIDVDAKYWLSKDFLKVEKLQSASVTHPAEADSWSVSRDSDTADMALADLGEEEELDSTKSYSLKNILSSPSFNDIADPAASEEDLGFNEGITAQLKTFDGFTYDISIGKADGDDNYPITVKIAAEIPTEREPAEDEKEEDKERLDKEFADNNKTLSDKLEKEKAFESWTYLVSKWTVDALLNKRADLIKQEEEEDPGTTGGAPSPLGATGPPAPDFSNLPANIQQQIQQQIQATAGTTDAATVPPAPEPEVEEAIDAVTNPVPEPEE